MIDYGDLINKGFEFEVFVAARYCYRMGFPIISDEVYDHLEDKLRTEQYDRCKAYLERTYDDDPIPTELLKVLGIEVVLPAVPTELYQYLEEEQSNSIRAIRSYEEAYDFARANAGKELLFSLKLDGVNKKMLYVDGEFRLSLSRGRRGNCLDYTQGSVKVVPLQTGTDGIVKITAECFVEPKALPQLRKKYNTEKYKTSKSSAISMLRVPHEKEDYKWLNVCAFCVEGMRFETVSDEYQYLETVGFKTPPHFTAIPPVGSYEVFKEWLDKEVLERLAEYKSVYPSDGVVMEVNSLTEVYAEKNQYSDRQVAIKFGKWGFECLRGVITDIIIKQRRVYKSVRIRIEPVHSSDGCKAEYINSFNPGILVENDLRVGKEVMFERNAGAVNILIHGKRLQELTGGENNGA